MIHDSDTQAKVSRLRADTPACEDVVHFDNAGSSLPPRPVVDRVIRHLRLEERVGGYVAAEEVHDELADGYATLARLVGARPEEIAITDSATRSWVSVFTGVSWREGDRVLTAAAEYSSNLIAMFAAARERGVHVEQVPSTADGGVDVAALSAMLDDRVRMVAITHAPTNGGLVQPVERIGAALTDHPALFLVDACQSVGQLPLDLDGLNADAVSATGRKYLRAPRGTGFLAVRGSALEHLNPVHVDLDSAWIEDDRVRLRGDARRFELFERNVAAVLGLGEAARYYLDVGPQWVHEYVTGLAEHLRDRLTELSGVEVTDIGACRSGIVSFRTHTVPARELVARLKERGFHATVSRASSTPWDMGARGLDELVRASVHYYNTPDEVARFCAEVASTLR